MTTPTIANISYRIQQIATHETPQTSRDYATKKIMILQECNHLMLFPKNNIFSTTHCTVCNRNISVIAVNFSALSKLKNQTDIKIISKIQLAISCKNYNLLLDLIKNDNSLVTQYIDFTDQNINTDILNYAVIKGDLAAVKLLINLGANINTLDDNGYTVLYNSCKHPEITKYLLNNGADPRIISDNKLKVNALGYAIEFKHITSITTILKRDETLIHENSRKNILPLQQADSLKDPALAPFIVNWYKKIQTKILDSNNYESNLFLHIACEKNDSNAIEGALIYNTSKLKKQRLVRYLNQSFQGKTALHLLCEKKNTTLIHKLLKHGASLVKKDINGNTAMHILFKKRISNTFLKVVLNHIPKKYLNKPVWDNEYLLIVADKYCNAELIEKLIELGCGFNYNDFENDRPPRERLSMRKVSFNIVNDITETIEEDNTDKIIKSKKTLLEKVFTSRHSKQMINTIISNIDDINQPLPSGHTLLFAAVKYDNRDAITLLLKANADIICQNSTKQTPLELAFDKYQTTRNSKIIDTLLADANATNIKTLFDYAQHNGHATLASYLMKKYNA